MNPRCVTIANVLNACFFCRVSSSAITCLTSKWVPELEFKLGKFGRRRRRGVDTDTLLEGSVNVTIDAANLHATNLHFTYKKDPIITSVEPKASILR